MFRSSWSRLAAAVFKASTSQNSRSRRGRRRRTEQLESRVLLSAGALDDTFDGDGVVTTSIGNSDDLGRVIAIQADGKIVVGGESHNGDNNDFSVVRYNTDGSIDTSFGVDGKAILDFAGSRDTVNAVAIQSDGKILLAGLTQVGSYYNFAIARLDDTGILDSTFGVNGKQITAVSTLDDYASALVIQSDGRILAGGFAHSGVDLDYALVRYTADGTLEQIVTTNIGSGNDEASDIAIFGSKVVLFGSSQVGSTKDFSAVRYNIDTLSVDYSFGTTGKITTPVGGGTSQDFARSMAIAPDGKIVLAGYSQIGSRSYFALARYSSTGVLDSSFDADGRVTTEISDFDDIINDIAIQPDGKIVAVGYSRPANTGRYSMQLVRYNVNGSLDSSFDGDGKRSLSLGTNHSVATSVAIQPDGRILAAGYSHNGSNYDFTTLRVVGNSEPTNIGLSSTTILEALPIGTNVGTLSTTDPDGLDTFTYSLVNGTGSTDNGSFTITGDTLKANSNFDFETKSSYAIRVRTTDQTGKYFEKVFTINVDDFRAGVLDPSFDSDGIVSTPIGNSDDLGRSIAIQSDGKILVTGESYNGSYNVFGVARYHSNGTLDTSFGTGGKAVVEFDGQRADSTRVAIQNVEVNGVIEERIILAGYKLVGDDYDFAMARLLPNGQLDTSFGNLGKRVTQIVSSGNAIFALAIQPDGKILAGGFSHNGNDNDYALARYTIDGTLDNEFGTGGIIIKNLGLDAGQPNDTANDIILQGDRIILAGYSIAGGANDFSAVRYLSNGAIDTTFGGSGTGILNTPFTTGSADSATSMALAPGGKLVLAGYTQTGTRSVFALTRYSADGILDNTFGTGGKVTTAISDLDDRISDIEIRPDGKIVAVGYTRPASTGRFSMQMVRYNVDGSLDSSFDGDGKRTFTFGTTHSLLYRLAIQPDGRILATGYSHNGSNYDFALLRVEGTSEPTNIALSSTVILENQPVGTTVGTLSSTDPDGLDTFTYSLVSGTGSTDNASFIMTDNTLKANAVFDFETKSSYSVRVRTTDQTGKWFEKVFSVSVTDLNEAPTANGRDIRTFAGSGESITFTGSDPEGESLIWSIAELPSQGTLTGSGNSRTYTPYSGYVGIDQFYIVASDGTNTSNQAIIRITNEGTVRPEVTLSASTLSVAESTGSLVITAQIDTPQAADLVVPLNFSGTATPGRDFLPVSELVIRAGQTTVTGNVVVIDDLIYETANETIIATIPASQSYLLGSPVSRTITLTNDDSLPTVSFRSKSISTEEADLLIDVSLVLNAESQTATTIPLVWTGTAVSGQDFIGPDQVTIPAGSRIGTVQIRLVDDTLAESTETIRVSMGTPTGATVSSFGIDSTSLTITIGASDTPIVSLGSTSLRAHESAGQVTITAMLATPASTPLSVPFTISGTATGGGIDFTATSGSFAFAVGAITATAAIHIADDALLETTETIVVSLSESGDYLRGTVTSTTLQILDNDAVTVSFQNQLLNVWENEGPAIVRANVSAASTATRIVPVVLWLPKVPIAGYAVPGADFQLFPLQLVFQPGSTISDPLQIPFINDLVNETDEQISLALKTTPGIEIGVVGQMVVVIRDNDPLVRLAVLPSASEAFSARAFHAQLDHPTNVDVYVPFVVSGTAQNGLDYTSPSSNLIRIPAGSTTGIVTFNVINDSIFEDDESLTVRINTPANGTATLNSPTSGTSIIYNDDGVPRVALSPGDYFVHKGQQYFYKKLSEAGGTRKLVLYKDGATSKDVRVRINSQGSGYYIDGPISNGWVTIPASQSSVTLTIRAIDNLSLNGSKDISFAISDIDNNAVAPNRTPVTFRIIDNEGRPNPNYGITLPPGILAIPNTWDKYFYDENLNEVPIESIVIPTGSGSSISASNPFTLSTPGMISSSGLLDGSTVFIDSNENGIIDFIDLNDDGIQQSDEPNEISGETALDGSFSLLVLSEYDRNNDGFVDETEGRYVVIGGIDEAIGLPLKTSLKAPMAATVITPLTTLAESMIRTAGMTLADAIGRVAESTGAPGYNFATRASVYDILQGDLDAVTVYREILKLQGTVVGLGELLFSASEAQQSLELLTDVVYADIAAKLAAPGAILDYSQSSVLESILRGAIFRTGMILPESVITGAASVIAANNASYDALLFSSYTTGEAFLHDMLKVKKVMLGDAATALNEAGKGAVTISSVLTSFTGASLTTRIAAAIVAADAAPPGLGVENAVVREGSDGTKILSFTVRLEGDHSRPVSVQYRTLDDSASAESGDYIPVSGTLSWAAGDNSSRLVEVTTNGDTVFEADEFFRLQLLESSGAVIRLQEGFGFILNDEQFVVEPDSKLFLNEFLITDSSNAAGVDRNGTSIFHGQFSDGLQGAISGAIERRDELTMNFTSTDSRSDVIQFNGGSGAHPSEEDRFVATDGDFSWIQYSALGSGNATVKFLMANSTRQSEVQLLDVEQLDLFVSSAERMIIRIHGVVADLVLEDADTNSAGRIRVRSLSGDISPIEFTNPTAELIFLFDSAESSVTVTSNDPAFAGVITTAVSGITISSNSVAENASAGILVGNLSSTNPDVGHTFAYALVAGDGSADNASFAIVGNSLRTTASFDFETKSSYSIRVRSTDPAGLSSERTLAITVTDVAEDVAKPVSAISALPVASTSVSFTISASGSDPGTGASGVKEYDLYYSTGGAFTKFATVPVGSPSTTFTGSANTTYWFRSLARDYAGNVETKNTADTYTRIGDVVPPVTQVTSETHNSNGLFTVSMTGTKASGSALTQFDVYVSIDGSAAVLIGSTSGGVANGSGVYSGAIAFQGLADGNSHTYRFYSRGRDGAGNVEAAPADVDLTVTISFSAVPFSAVGIDVQNGANQRSYVRYLDVLFSNAAALAAWPTTNRVKVERFGIEATSVIAGSGTVVNGGVITKDGSKLKLDFGATGLGGLNLAGNGFYRILLDIDGNGSFSDAADQAFEFYRLFGDANGDRKVDVADTDLVTSQVGRSGSNFDGDMDGNGVVNGTDRLYSTQQRGKKLLDPLLGWLDD